MPTSFSPYGRGADVLCALIFPGRGYLGYELTIPAKKVGTFDTELVEEFFLAFVRNANMTLHIRQLSGSNSHHIIEGAFKAFGRVCKRRGVHRSRFRGGDPFHERSAVR